MGVYIKGMEMPKSCFYCPMRWKVDPDNIKCLATGEVFEETFTATIEMRNAGNCPLVPVPKHGRLIEAEPIVKYVTDGLNSGELGYDAIKVMTEVEYAPTIIPAEEGE